MKGLSVFTALLLLSMCTTNNSTVKDGNKYVPYDQRDGEEAVVYFTRNLSPEGLIAAYEKVNGDIEGRVGVKLHTGEQNGPNIIPREWVKALIEKDLPDAKIIETNTYYEGDPIPPRPIGRRSRSMAGPSARWTSSMRRIPSRCRSSAASGSTRCPSAAISSIMTPWWR